MLYIITYNHQGEVENKGFRQKEVKKDAKVEKRKTGHHRAHSFNNLLDCDQRNSNHRIILIGYTVMGVRGL